MAPIASRAKRAILVLGAIASGTAVLLAGCGNRDQPPPPAAAAVPATTIGTEIDDTVITARVKSALLADPEIKSFDLKVETRKGEVQLSGFVNTTAQIDLALQSARAVQGVTSVTNGLSLKDGNASIGTTVDDGIITAGVKSALLAEPAMKSFDIAVVTRKGEVQLSGFVDSQAQIDQAVAIATAVSGVTRVSNEMRIKQ